MKLSAWTELQRHISLVFTGSGYQCLYMIYQYESLQSFMCTVMTGLDLNVQAWQPILEMKDHLGDSHYFHAFNLLIKWTYAISCREGSPNQNNKHIV